MVWTNIGLKAPGDVVTSEIWNQAYDNLAALAGGLSGAPSVVVESALNSSGTAGNALVVGAGGAVTTTAMVSVASGTVVDDGGDGGTITIPPTISTTLGSVYRWHLVKITDVTNYTLDFASGMTYRCDPTSTGGPPTWITVVIAQQGLQNLGVPLPDVIVTVNGSDQLVINVNTDMDLDTFSYTLETVR